MLPSNVPRTVGDAPSRLGAATGALRKVLSNPAIRGVQASWSGCIVAEFALTTALGVYAFRVGGAVAVGLVGLVRALPAALVGPFAAALVERLPRERALLAILAGRVAAVSVAAGAALAEAPAAVVFAAAAVDAVVYSVYWPAQSSLLVELAEEPDDLTAANATSTTIENLGALAGPVLAGAVLAAGSPGAVLALCAVLLVGSTALAARVRRPPGGRTPGVEGPRDAFAGFRLLRREARPRLVVFLYLAQTLCLGAANALVVLIAIDLLDLGDTGVGLLAAAVGAGGVAGSIGSLWLVGRAGLGTWFRVALIVWGAGLLVAVAAPHSGVATAGLVLVGLAGALVDVIALTLLQRLVRSSVLTRVLGLIEGLWWAALGLGAFLAALLVDVTGIRAGAVAVAALLPVLATITSQPLVAIDRTAVDLAVPLELLRRLPLFAPLPTLGLERVALAAYPLQFAAGEVIIRRGDPGDRFYVLAAGEVDVTHDEGITALGPGSSFGEIALLHDVPRTATVQARTPVQVYALDRGDFLRAVRARTGIGAE